MGLFNALHFIVSHPLNRNQKLRAITRYLIWQVGSRLVPGSVIVPFVNDSRLIARQGMPGATLNIYGGLHEFEHMSFALHLLRKTDLFVDVGANIGSYTVLASKSIGAKCISIEPIPSTFNHLLDNVNLNGIAENVNCLNIALGSKTGFIRMTSKLDCCNRALPNGYQTKDSITVPVRTIDDVVGTMQPVLIKIDVEGYESEILNGANSILSSTALLCLIIETDSKSQHEGVNTISITKKIKGYGFKPYSYDPFTRKLLQLDGVNTSSENTLYINDFKQATDRVKDAAAYVVKHQRI